VSEVHAYLANAVSLMEDVAAANDLIYPIPSSAIAAFVPALTARNVVNPWRYFCALPI
jgi:hypothetical protein